MFCWWHLLSELVAGATFSYLSGVRIETRSFHNTADVIETWIKSHIRCCRLSKKILSKKIFSSITEIRECFLALFPVPNPAPSAPSLPPSHPPLHKNLSLRPQFRLMQMEIIDRPNPHEALPSMSRTPSIHQRAASLAEEVRHRVS